MSRKFSKLRDRINGKQPLSKASIYPTSLVPTTKVFASIPPIRIVSDSIEIKEKKRLE